MAAFHPKSDALCHARRTHDRTGSYLENLAKSGPAAIDPIADVGQRCQNSRMTMDRYLSPGTKVRLESIEGEPEEGVVVHCWVNNEIDAYDCYVAFHGSKLAKSEPWQKPYVLRYAASSLKVIEPSEPAMMLRDTVVWLLDQQKDQRGDADFDRGYRMGYGFALDTLKNQCDTFGLADELGWMQPNVEKWLKTSD